MGRRTWESIASPLPGREIWLLSRQMTEFPHGRIFATPSELVKALANQSKPVFFAGGEMIFRWAIGIPEVQRLYLTWIFIHTEGDTTFPAISEEEWQPYAWEYFYEGCISFTRVEYHRQKQALQ